jgi:hypothetical protein
LKKRTKEENRAYSKKLRDKKKAQKTSLAASNPLNTLNTIAPAPEMTFLHSADTIAPIEQFNPEPPEPSIISVETPFTRDKLPDCAECARLNAELQRLREEAHNLGIEIRRSIDVIARQGSIIKDLKEEIESLYNVSSPVPINEPVPVPNTAASGSGSIADQNLFDRVVAAKINRFGRNTSIGCIR